MLADTEQSLSARGIALWLAGLNTPPHQRLKAMPQGTAPGSRRMGHHLMSPLHAWPARPQPMAAGRQ
jgi:hypothetical protein